MKHNYMCPKNYTFLPVVLAVFFFILHKKYSAVKLRQLDLILWAFTETGLNSVSWFLKFLAYRI